MAVDGLGVAYVTAGFVLAYAGIKNTKIKDTLTAFLKGSQPNPNPTGPLTVGVGKTGDQSTAADTQIGNASGGPVTANTITSIQNYGVARMVAGTYGWAGGNEWASLTEVINAESGGNANATNPSSGAYGIAQALGHGTANTQGSVTNQYGGYGLPDSTAVAANSGNASAQLQWMMAYIKATYGDPVAAWAHESTYHWY